MKGKAGGSLAISAVVAALAYLSSGVKESDTKMVAPMATQSSSATTTTAPVQQLSESAKPIEQPFESVEVFYATDRALLAASQPIKRQVLGGIVATTGLGVLALTAWLEWRRRRTLALVTVISGTAVAATLMFLGPQLVAWMRGTEVASGVSPYGGGRGALQLGKCEVTIPRVHQSGEVERPSILRLEFSENLERHVTLRQVIPQAELEFYQAVKRRVQASPQQDLFVFVHGFNVSFEAAARRTAQIAHDLEYAGAPIFYSWPSQGQAWDYTVDETNVVWSVPNLKKFLTDLARESDAKAINLIAHSMGTRALTQAIRELAYECEEDTQLFQHVILAAPDIDADVFKDQIAPALTRHTSKVTLYASAGDEALAASKLVHGARRAGESASPALIVQGVDTIDVELGDLGLLGHSYYSNPLVLRDLNAILRESRPASLRPWLAPLGDEGARYWAFHNDGTSTARRPENSTTESR